MLAESGVNPLLGRAIGIAPQKAQRNPGNQQQSWICAPERRNDPIRFADVLNFTELSREAYLISKNRCPFADTCNRFRTAATGWLTRSLTNMFEKIDLDRIPFLAVKVL
jgi:molybdenum cofactor biosynthesis enzyme MoaA